MRFVMMCVVRCRSSGVVVLYRIFELGGTRPLACSIMSTAVGITLTAAGTAKSMAAKQQVCGTRFNGSARTCGFAVPNTQLYAELICEEEIVKLCDYRTKKEGIRL